MPLSNLFAAYSLRLARTLAVINTQNEGKVDVIRIPEHVIYDSVGSDAVVINLVTGAYFALTEAGKEGWDQVASGAQVSKQDVLKVLVDEGLIETSEAEQSPGLNEEKNIAFELFTDLEEMLTADPVHDVDERGWPRTK